MLLVVAMLTNVALAAPVTGSHSTTLAGIGGKTAAYTVDNDSGAVSVTCSAKATEATSTLSWTLEGSDAAAVAAGLKATATKTGENGAFGVTAPKELSSLSKAEVSLVVVVPMGGSLTVVGGDGALSVTDCEGTLDVRNKGGDINLNVKATKVTANAPKGNVDLELSQGKLAAPSEIDAPIGNIAVSMPGYSANIDGTAASIAVSMPGFTATTQTATAIQGKAADGGALIKLKAPKGNLVLK